MTVLVRRLNVVVVGPRLYPEASPHIHESRLDLIPLEHDCICQNRSRNRKKSKVVDDLTSGEIWSRISHVVVSVKRRIRCDHSMNIVSRRIMREETYAIYGKVGGIPRVGIVDNRNHQEPEKL